MTASSDLFGVILCYEILLSRFLILPHVLLWLSLSSPLCASFPSLSGVTGYERGRGWGVENMEPLSELCALHV